ncbi:MAG: gamma-glutamyltransferase family protein, partial [Pseudomonadota bacterium]
PTPGEIVVEARVPAAVRDELAARGHVVRTVAGWSLNFTTAVAYDGARGVIEGGASSRGERNYAMAW